MEPCFFNCDISWLSFNERVLKEAGKRGLPVGEQINFLSIYSSNLDEFYRVRIPSLMGLEKVDKKKGIAEILSRIEEIIAQQQELYGQLIKAILQLLRDEHNVIFLYNHPIPDKIKDSLDNFFYTKIAADLQPILLEDNTHFFPENNKIYLAVSIIREEKSELAIIKIPSDNLKRFYSVNLKGTQYVAFLDDIILYKLKSFFPNYEINHAHSFKITRDAELDLKDTYEDNLAEKIREQVLKREMGYATRFLYDSNMPKVDRQCLIEPLNLKDANHMPGGPYHKLKDLSDLPLNKKDISLFYKKWESIKLPITQSSIFKKIEDGDFLLNPPYENYQTIIRFFNEAAFHDSVSEIYLSVYRIASDSSIAHSLIKAAENGKRVTVFVELKARFDEANNIHWAQKMEEAGVNIIYSIPGWKVHAKVALVKRKINNRSKYYGLLGTENFNETTAKVYADHILFTDHPEMLRELELLFLFLRKRKRIEGNPYKLNFKELLVARFNLFDQLNHLIDEEINQAEQGNPLGLR